MMKFVNALEESEEESQLDIDLNRKIKRLENKIENYGDKFTHDHTECIRVFNIINTLYGMDSHFLALLDAKYPNARNEIFQIEEELLTDIIKKNYYKRLLPSKLTYKFVANLDTAEYSDSIPNKFINNFVDHITLKKETDLAFKNILGESTLGIFPSTGIFNYVLNPDNFDTDELKIKNMRLLTATNTLVLPTIHLLNF